jgi:hypothetical protein
MQRIEFLIEKLKEQYLNNADSSSLLATIQMLQKEILGNMKESSVLGTSGISVFVPGILPILPTKDKLQINNSAEPEKEYFQLELIPEEIAPEDEIIIPQFQEQNFKNVQNISESDITGNNYPQHPESLQTEISFADIKETETVWEEVPARSLQFSTSEPQFNSKNVPIKTWRIKDLKKAISENDRQIFIKELFRKDEAMYERSMKTINGFHIYGEAEYWITRELRTKLGWPAHSEAADYFEQLIKRRFA